VNVTRLMDIECFEYQQCDLELDAGSNRGPIKGEARVSCLGGLSPGAWRAREREPITGIREQSPQRGPGAEPLVRGRSTLKLKTF